MHPYPKWLSSVFHASYDSEGLQAYVVWKYYHLVSALFEYSNYTSYFLPLIHHCSSWKAFLQKIEIGLKNRKNNALSAKIHITRTRRVLKSRLCAVCIPGYKSNFVGVKIRESLVCIDDTICKQFEFWWFKFPGISKPLSMVSDLSILHVPLNSLFLSLNQLLSPLCEGVDKL